MTRPQEDNFPESSSQCGQFDLNFGRIVPLEKIVFSA